MIRLHLSSYDSVTSSLANLLTECNVNRDVKPSTKCGRSDQSIRKGVKGREHQSGRSLVSGHQKEEIHCHLQLMYILLTFFTSAAILSMFQLIYFYSLIGTRRYGVISANIKLVGMWRDALHCEIFPSKTDQDAPSMLTTLSMSMLPRNPCYLPAWCALQSSPLQTQNSSR